MIRLISIILVLAFALTANAAGDAFLGFPHWNPYQGAYSKQVEAAGHLWIMHAQGNSNNTTEITVWGTNNDVILRNSFTPSTTGMTGEVASTSNDDTLEGIYVQTVRLFGVDDDYNFQTEVVNVTGQTDNDTTVTDWLAIYGMVIEDCGTTRCVSAGAVWAALDDTITLGVPQTAAYRQCVIDTGEAMSTNGYLIVPNNMKAKFEGDIILNAAKCTSYNTFRLYMKSYDQTNATWKNFKIGEWDVDANDYVTVNTDNFPIIPEKSHIYFTTLNATLETVEVTVDCSIRLSAY